MEVVLLSLALVGLAVLLLAFNIVFRKKPFPNTHISHNKNMRKLGIVCAKTMDRTEQKKAREELKFKNLTIAVPETDKK